MRYLRLLRSLQTSATVAASAADVISVNRGQSRWRNPAGRLTRFLSADASASSTISGQQQQQRSYDPLKSRTDLEELFLDRRVRSLLRRLTGYSPAKLFATKSLDNLSSPKYRFMTDEQLKMEKAMADQKAEKMLQMPPVKYPVEHRPKVLDQDAALQGFLDPSVKVILVDATPGYSDVERLIVVREADGTLREATREERHRSNQIFYPVEERSIELPKMLEDPHTEAVLNRSAYQLLLDTACLHLEPEDRRYIALTHRVYEHIAAKGAFDHLRSTRHYGGMLYYYVYFRRADSLLHHLLSAEEGRLEEAVHLLHLFYTVNPRKEGDLPVAFDPRTVEDISLPELAEADQESRQQQQLSSLSLEQLISLLNFYIANDSTNLAVKPRLQLNVQKLQQQLQQQQQSKEEVAQQN